MTKKKTPQQDPLAQLDESTFPPEAMKAFLATKAFIEKCD